MVAQSSASKRDCVQRSALVGEYDGWRAARALLGWDQERIGGHDSEMLRHRSTASGDLLFSEGLDTRPFVAQLIAPEPAEIAENSCWPSVELAHRLATSLNHVTNLIQQSAKLICGCRLVSPN